MPSFFACSRSSATLAEAVGAGLPGAFAGAFAGAVAGAFAGVGFTVTGSAAGADDFVAGFVAGFATASPAGSAATSLVAGCGSFAVAGALVAVFFLRLKISNITKNISLVDGMTAPFCTMHEGPAVHGVSPQHPPHGGTPDWGQRGRSGCS